MTVNEDWMATIGRVEGTAQDLHEAVGVVVDALSEARSERRAGVADIDVVKGLVARGGRVLRNTPTEAFREFERAVTDYRTAMIRTLVDEHRMTFTEIGQLSGVSRQMVARLYRRAPGSSLATEGRDQS
jgi:CRP-like cAMP-binding protein